VEDRVINHPDKKPTKVVEENLKDFLKNFTPYELEKGKRLHLFYDEKSDAHYITCHLQGVVLVESCDIDASLDTDDEDEIYRLNREVTEDPVAYRIMEEDALKGRSFEDIVLEYDLSYRAEKPLKVYGGQHRLRAIKKAVEKDIDVLHGVRIYFSLSREQKVEIAIVNNTAIAVPNDLIDRMREQLLGSELRDWCQDAGLLDDGQDFSDKRSSDIPTVRIVRTLIVNFYLGINNKDGNFHQPILCKSGGVDDEYLRIRSNIDWKNKNLLEMGKQFSRLHKLQRKTVSERRTDNYAEYARKALSLAVVGSWAYAAGLFQSDQTLLDRLYSLPDNVGASEDPLNAKALSQARLKGVDPDTYRGLGTRSSPKELGRMLEVFYVLVDKDKKRITKDLANAAIQSYEAKKASYDAEKALEKI